MASESLLPSCTSPFLRHLSNQWPWISLRGHPGHRYGYQSNARIHIPISDQWQLGPYLAPFQRYGGLNVENRYFSLPQIPAKIWGCSLWNRRVTLGYAKSEIVRLISREIIFKNSNLYYHDSSTSQTDRRTDNLPWQYRAPLGFAR